MQRFSAWLTVALWVAFTSGAHAIDHKNLDEGRPLRVEDAYPIAAGEIALETGLGFTGQRRGSDRGVFPLQVLYGAYPNLHIGLGTTFLTDPRDVHEQHKSGDLQLSALYNFNQETLTLPAFGFQLSVNFPTGVRSSGTDIEMKGLVTKSFDHLGFHLNGAYEFFNGTRHKEREGQYRFALGAGYAVGAPHYTRTVLLGNLFTEQSVRRGGSNMVGAEVGFRHQLTQRFVFDAGIGSEFSGPPDRSPLFLGIGFSFGF